MIPGSQDGWRRVRLLLLTALMLGAGGIGGCDCTSPRGKPWRHEPDTESLAAAQPRSPALARDEEVSDVLANRDHTLRIHMESEPRALNPLVAPGVWARRITMGTVFETLIRYEPPAGGAGAGPGQYAPGLARSWRISPDGREIRFTLEPGVKFHDGRTMTSVDVQWTLDSIRSLRNDVDHLRPMLASVAAVELVTSREVRLVLYKPDGWVLRALAEIPILPMHVYDGSFAAGGRIVGTGPWQLESWKDGTVHLARFGGYWGNPPAIDDLEFVYEQDAARALMEAKRGAIDIVPELIPAHLGQAQAPGIAASFAPLDLRPPRLRYLAFRCTEAPLDDARVRHAIALLLDRDELVESYDGLVRAVMGPVWPGGIGDGPTPPLPGPDRIDEAAALLAAAGWVDSDRDGVRDRNGQRLTVDALVLERPDPPPGQPRKDPVRDALLAPLTRPGAGIHVETRAGTEAVLMNQTRAGTFGIVLLEVAQPVDTDLTALLGAGGALNYGGCSSRRVDAALDALRAAWEPAARVPLIAALAAAVAESWPIAGVVSPAPQGLIARRVQGAVIWDGWIDLRRLSFSGD
jgi:peptide/nickel transport system substrate-binding protein